MHQRKLTVEEEFKLRSNLRILVEFSLQHMLQTYFARPCSERRPKGWLLLAYAFLVCWVLMCAMLILVYGMQVRTRTRTSARRVRGLEEGRLGQFQRWKRCLIKPARASFGTTGAAEQTTSADASEF